MNEEVDQSQSEPAEGKPWSRPAAEQERIEAISERQFHVIVALSDLAEASGALGEGLVERLASESLWNVVLLDHELQAHPPAVRLVEPANRVHSLLPFSDEELERLVGRMKSNELPELPDVSAKWYRRPTREDFLLVERWRHWLGELFPGGVSTKSSTNGQDLLAALREMDEVLGDLV